MDEKRRLVASLERLAALPALTLDQLHDLAEVVLALGYHELSGAARRLHEEQLAVVKDTYRVHLETHLHDARALNNLTALLLSNGLVVEGRVWACRALEEAPGVAEVHTNMMIADVYNQVVPFHQIPGGLTTAPGFLVAYFDPHGH